MSRLLASRFGVAAVHVLLVCALPIIFALFAVSVAAEDGCNGNPRCIILDAMESNDKTVCDSLGDQSLITGCVSAVDDYQVSLKEQSNMETQADSASAIPGGASAATTLALAVFVTVAIIGGAIFGVHQHATIKSLQSELERHNLNIQTSVQANAEGQKERLARFVEGALAQGYSESMIKSRLAGAGWDEENIERSFFAAQGKLKGPGKEAAHA